MFISIRLHKYSIVYYLTAKFEQRTLLILLLFNCDIIIWGARNKAPATLSSMPCMPNICSLEASY